MLAFELAMRFFFGFCFFEGRELSFGEDDAVLGHFGFQSFQPLLHRLQIMAQPNAADAGGRDSQPALSEFIGDTHLPKSWLFDSEFDYGAIDLFCDAVAKHRLLAGDFGERDLPAFIVKLLEAVEAVTAIAHHLSGLASGPEKHLLMRHLKKVLL